jgi:EamA domain-containing membrane protein RarD
MGLLVCVVSFALGFAAIFSALARSDVVDPEGFGGTPFLVILIALCALSAMFGARKHQRWLSEHMKGAVLCGVAAGIVTGIAILAFGVVSTWGPSTVVAVLFFVVRFTFIVWPAFIVHGAIAVARRRAFRAENAV